ncbi:MAG TPA: cupin domain-containing protein [Vicinamibacterales bacterium]|nr:cupin domain-containing protein [Vicinamibacterales bacterium]
MLRSRILLASLLVAGSSGWIGRASARAVGDLNPKAIAITMPNDIKWTKTAASERAVLYGDPSKPGYYVVLQKWLPHHNSRPHFHPNDRFITVLSGTWWVQTGAKYDPDGFKPVPAGSFVVHHAKEIHYDGAKDEPCVLEIAGMGPETSVQAEEK